MDDESSIPFEPYPPVLVFLMSAIVFLVTVTPLAVPVTLMPETREVVTVVTPLTELPDTVALACWNVAMPTKPILFAEAALMAAFMYSPVSRAIPNRPSPSCSSTSSEVVPRSATSKSWIAAEPFMAMVLMTPRWIQSMRYGAQPVLMTCPPIAATTILPSPWARAR